MLYYVESEVSDEKIISKDMIPQIQEKIMNKIDEVRNTKNFERKLGPLCDYCYYFAEFCNGR